LGELVRLSMYTSAMIKLLRGDIESLGEFDVSITERSISPEWAGLLLTLRS
jgi:hypothetical protein